MCMISLMRMRMRNEKWEKYILLGVCELMWCFKNVNFLVFKEIYLLFFEDFFESKLLIKGFFF